jgi:hypothetical protein
MTDISTRRRGRSLEAAVDTADESYLDRLSGFPSVS